MANQDGYRVTLIPGDGIGPEVTSAATEIVAAAGVKIDWDRQVAGLAAVEAVRDPLPEETLRSIRKHRVALKGPLTTGVGRGFRSINVAFRKAFDLYANVLPILNLPGLKTAF